MTLQVVAYGRQLFAENAAGFLNAGAYYLHLFQNDFTPTQDSVLGDFVEADFGGYAAQTIPSIWADAGPIGIREWCVNGGAIAFTYTGGTTNSIYGYWVDDGIGVLWAERDPAAPVNMTTPGDQYVISLRISFRSEFGGGALQIQDDFVDTDGTLVDAHTIAPINNLAQSWVTQLGTIDIQSNAPHLSAGSRGIATVDAGTGDVLLTIGPGTTIYGLTLRFVDTSNYLRILWFSGQIYLQKVVAGVPSTLASFASSALGFSVSAISDALIVQNTAGMGITVSDSDFLTATLHGIYFETSGSTSGTFTLST